MTTTNAFNKEKVNKIDGARLLSLFREQPHVFLLDSSLSDQHRGRYSFVGFDPYDVFLSRSPRALDELKQKFMPYRIPSSDLPTPFPCGITGYLSYDFGLYQEKIRCHALDDLHLPFCVFGFYDCVLTIDHLLEKLYVTSSGLPETSSSAREKRARERLRFIEHRLSCLNTEERSDRHLTAKDDPAGIELESHFTQPAYERMVQKALDHIDRGDIYQVNLSQRFVFDPKGYHVDSFEMYSSLRMISPTQFGGYFNAGDHQIMSSSPEQFLRLEGRRIVTRPMKGTRSRGFDHREDEFLKAEILNSSKEQAELLMVTDLERNDLGKVCEYGSVKVSEMRELEEYQTVFQTTSTIEGILEKKYDAFDAIKACFPGGSVTGCPKIRAMEIIEELEPTRRGIYTGTLGYVSFSGDMNFNVLIRTLLAYQGKIYFQVGGGIVADSNPTLEYEETLIKARAMRVCLEKMFQKNSVTTIR